MGIIASGKIYSDILKLTIDSTYIAPKKEIDAYRNQKSQVEQASLWEIQLVHSSASQIRNIKYSSDHRNDIECAIVAHVRMNLLFQRNNNLYIIIKYM